MKSGARWMTKENGKRLIIRVIWRVLQGLRDFALRAAPLHLRGAGLKSLRALPPPMDNSNELRSKLYEG